MRVLVVTKLFPNALEPTAVPFLRQQFSAMGQLCQLEVLAAIPWFPGARAFSRWSKTGRLLGVPRAEKIAGLEVTHPRFMYLPKIGYGLNGALFATSLLPAVLRYRGKIDVLIGAWAYPDGVAAVMLAHLLGVPSVIKVVGTDINVVAKMTGPRLNLRLILPGATRVVAVSRPLAQEVCRLGVDPDRVDVVYNGVNTELFHPRDRQQARAALGRDAQEKMILYVGSLLPSKGVQELIDAFTMISANRPELKLVIVGEGPLRTQCAARAQELPGKIHLAGQVPLDQIPSWIAACDLLSLPSYNEGTPNVVMEALACGRRVVTTRVGGTPDIMSSPMMGALVPPRDSGALAEALARIVEEPYDPLEVAASRQTKDWAGSAADFIAVLKRAVEEYAAQKAGQESR